MIPGSGCPAGERMHMKKDIGLVLEDIVCFILLYTAFAFVVCSEWFGRRASD